nr:MFS transporter [Amycolatopsis antarctica]
MSLFALRDYRHLFAAQVIALLGTGLATVALGLLAYRLAGGNAGMVLGSALVLKMVTYVVIAPVAGAYADRLPRRATLVALDLIRALVVLALPFVSAVWQVYVLIVVLQAASAAFTPAFQAVLPDILPTEREYTRALSAAQFASTMESLLSPAAAAAALTVVSFPWLFTATSVCFAGSALLVVTASIPAAAPVGRAGVRERLTAGLWIHGATPRLRGLLGLNLAVASAGAMVVVSTVNYVRDTLGRSPVDVALLLAANGVGTALAAAALPALLARLSERPVMLAGGAVLTGGAVCAVVLSTVDSGSGRMPAAMVVWSLLGVGAGLVLTPVGRVLRRSTGAADRPAIFAAQFSLSHACWVPAYAIAGFLGSAAGFTVAWSVLTLLAAGGLLVAARAWPRPDPEAIEHVHRAPVGDPGHLLDAVEVAPGAWRHRHTYVIDDMHRRWPAAG